MYFLLESYHSLKLRVQPFSHHVHMLHTPCSYNTVHTSALRQCSGDSEWGQEARLTTCWPDSLITSHTDRGSTLAGWGHWGQSQAG